MSGNDERAQSGPGAPWEPRIVAFVCRWCTYAGADLAGTSRLKYPPQIRMIKLPCTGRIDPLFLLRAFAMGADGVLVSGCHPGDCHYTSGNYAARRRWVVFRELLDLVGVEQERLHFSWVSAAEGGKFVEIVKKVTDSVRAVGPFAGFVSGEDALGHGYAENRAVARLDGGRGGVGAGGDELSAADLDRMRADLASGSVKSILGPIVARIPGRLRAAWITAPEAVSRLRRAGANRPPLVPLLLRRLRQDPEGIHGIVAGPAESAALLVLAAEHQVDPARIIVYSVNVPATPAASSVATPAADPAAGSPPPESTLLASIAAARNQAPVPLVPDLSRPAAERRAFWNAAFDRCVRCYACREACPLCSCVQCVADKTRPRWIDSSATPDGNWLWNVTRAFHLAGRCIECGACTEACPVGIPLSALSIHLNRVIEQSFGSRQDGEAARSALLSFRLEDEAPFIM